MRSSSRRSRRSRSAADAARRPPPVPERRLGAAHGRLRARPHERDDARDPQRGARRRRDRGAPGRVVRRRPARAPHGCEPRLSAARACRARPVPPGARRAGAGLRLWARGVGRAALPLAWLVLKDYQRERILVFLDPFRDPLGSAYNVIQAKIAIGSGQLLGKGVAGATQSRLAFLPERHTDFVFAVFAETWGFVGCLALLMCYLLLLLRGFDIAASSREPVGRLVALGLTSLLAVQVVINLGMVTGLLPIVGIPLPLMSYGGSSMLASLVAIGLLLSVRMRQFQ